MIYIYSHNNGEGSRNLARAMGIRRLKHEGSRVVPVRTDAIINWGSTSLPARFRSGRVINKPELLERATNKLTFFQLMKDVKLDNGKSITPDFFTSKAEAIKRLRDKGGFIVCRKVLNGSGGKGIVIAETEDQVVAAPLYTRYIPKQSEYRIHILNGNIIDQQEKGRRLDVANPDWRVRNLENGFIYKREGVRPPASVRDVSLKCMSVIGLDFGAVDVVYNEKNNRAYVLEVNTAPGLEGQTVVNYANAFREWLR